MGAGGASHSPTARAQKRGSPPPPPQQPQPPQALPTTATSKELLYFFLRAIKILISQLADVFLSDFDTRASCRRSRGPLSKVCEMQAFGPEGRCICIAWPRSEIREEQKGPTRASSEYCEFLVSWRTPRPDPLCHQTHYEKYTFFARLTRGRAIFCKNVHFWCFFVRADSPGPDAHF